MRNERLQDVLSVSVLREFEGLVVAGAMFRIRGSR